VEICVRELTDGRDKSNSITSNQTTDDHRSKRRRSRLEDTTNGKCETTRNNGPSTSNAVGNIASDQSTEEGAAGEDTGQKRLLPS
jgi:hypothetical protein